MLVKGAPVVCSNIYQISPLKNALTVYVCGIYNIDTNIPNVDNDDNSLHGKWSSSAPWGAVDDKSISI